MYVNDETILLTCSFNDVHANGTHPAVSESSHDDHIRLQSHCIHHAFTAFDPGILMMMLLCFVCIAIWNNIVHTYLRHRRFPVIFDTEETIVDCMILPSGKQRSDSAQIERLLFSLIYKITCMLILSFFVNNITHTNFTYQTLLTSGLVVRSRPGTESPAFAPSFVRSWM